MYAMWVSLREHVNCGSNPTDVIHQRQRLVQNRSYRILAKEKSSNASNGNSNARGESHPKLQSKIPNNIGFMLLLFYGTTMTCCTRNPDRVSELCKDPSCRVCRIIQSGFKTVYSRKKGIQLSTSSQEMSGNMISISKGKDVKRALIVCRTIAGRVLGVVNMVDGENVQEYDSIGSRGLCASKLEHLVVQNPNAVLPCFVIVFN